MDKTLKIKIKVDKDTGAVSVVGGEFDNLDAKVQKTGNSVSGFSSKLKGLAVGIGTIYTIKQAFDFSVEIAKTGIAFESLTDSLNAATGGVLQGRDALKFLKEETDRLGTPLEASTDGFKSLSAAAEGTVLNATAIRKIFLGVSEASAVMKLSTDDTNGVFRALSQIMSKGTVQAEELRGQLGERIPGAFNIASKAMGVTTAELNKMLEQGQVISSEFLPKFAAELTQRFSDDVPTAAASAKASMNRFGNELLNLKVSIAESGVVDLVQYFTDMGTEILKATDNLIKGFRDIQDLKTYEDLGERAVELSVKKVEANKALASSWTTLGKNLAKKELEEIEAAFLDIEQQIKLLDRQSDTLVKKDTKDEPYDMSEFDKFGFEMFKEYEKKSQEAKEKELKASHDLAQKQLSMIQKSVDDKIKLEENYADTLVVLREKQSSYFLDSLAKEAYETFTHYESLKEKYAEVAGVSEALSALQNAALGNINTKIEEQNDLLTRNALLDSITESTNSMQDMLDIQIALTESGKDWASGLSGTSAALAEVGNSFKKLHVDKMKLDKADLKSQSDYAKAFLSANGDIVKEKEALAKFDSMQAMLREQEMDSYIGAFGSLAGAVSNYASQSSSASKAAEAAEKALAVVQAVRAVIRAWGDPYPLNLITVPATIAATGALLSSIGASGGGGGGGISSISSTGETYEQNRQNIEMSYTPITDRLDRQIALWERFLLQGSASFTGIERANVGFDRDYRLFLEDTFEAIRKDFDLRVIERQGFSADAFVAEMERIDDIIGGELFTSQNVEAAAKMSDAAKGFLNEDVLREGDNMLIFLAEASRSIYGQMALVDDIHENWGENIQKTETYFANTLNNIFELTAEYANNMLDVMDELRDASETMKEAYDNITGSAYYETQRLMQAFNEFDVLRGSASYADYLQEQITAIDALNKELDTDLIDLLLSEDPTRIQEQVEAIEELGRVSGIVFEGGAEDALNYLESINLVAEAMSSSRKNINSWFDSLKTDEQRAQDMADALGVRVANNVGELSYLFSVLSNDMDGLTDSELEFLNANKALLESTETYETQIESLNATLDDVTGNISTLEGALGSISPVIDKLKAATQTSSQSLQEYYAAMDFAESLRTSTDYEAYAKSLKDVASASSILFNQDAFTSSFEQRFAQLTALNQFQGLESVTLEEIDYLKLIEENTREQITVLTDAMNQLGANINSSLLENTKALKESTSSATSTPTTASYIQDIYTKYDLHQYQNDSSGYLYWGQQVSNGAIAVENLDAAIKAAAVENLMIHGSHFNGLEFVPFDGYRAELHYGERVLTAKDNSSMADIVIELIELRKELKDFKKENSRQQSEISKNTQESRFIS